MPAIGRCGDEIVVVADADAWTDGLPEAVQAVEGGAPWAVPHSRVHRLTEKATGKALAGEPFHGQEVEQRPYMGVLGGGFVVAPREVILSIPLDGRFVGWGQEDECWSMALNCLVGPPVRGSWDLWHLYHPPQPRLTRRHGSQESWALRRRYLRARHDPVQMQKLVEEAHAWSPS
jgi:hypothetical protein